LHILGNLQNPFRLKELQDILNKHAPHEIGVQAIDDTQLSAEDLQFALDNYQIYVVYQPQVKISDKSLLGVEALVR